MRKLTGFFLFAALLTACQNTLYNPFPSSLRSRSSQAVRKEVQEDSAAARPGMPDIYVTALSYPDWADWRAGDERGAQVLLFKNGKRVASVPGSGGFERHRFREGHLWTDRTDGAETILYCDGEEVFRFEGEELFLGFCISDGRIHTLGQRPDGRGFSYRLDGRELYTSPTGTLMGSPSDREWSGGAFSEELHYVYGLPVGSTDGQLWEYHVMKEVQPVKTLPAGSAEAVFDLRYWQGHLYRSERRTGGSYCLVKDDTYQALPLDPPVHLCKLAPYGDEMLVKGYNISLQMPYYHFWLRGAGGQRFEGSASARIQDLYVCDGDAVMVTLDDEGRVNGIKKDGEWMAVKASAYALATPLCCDYRQGVFAAALSSAEGTEHLLIMGDDSERILFNGYFTSLQIL